MLMRPSMAPEPSDTKVFADLRTHRSKVFGGKEEKYERIKEAAHIDLKRTNAKP